MAKNRRFERICTICGKQYEYCPTCSKYDHLPRWMDAYCSENCKDLYNITAGWVNGWLDKDVEMVRLGKMDLSNLNKFPKWMQETIKEIKNYKPEVPVETLEKVLDADNKTEKIVEEKPAEKKNAPPKKEKNVQIPKKDKLKN